MKSLLFSLMLVSGIFLGASSEVNAQGISIGVGGYGQSYGNGYGYGSGYGGYRPYSGAGFQLQIGPSSGYRYGSGYGNYGYNSGYSNSYNRGYGSSYYGYQPNYGYSSNYGMRYSGYGLNQNFSGNRYNTLPYSTSRPVVRGNRWVRRR